jgi:hypothetical protein
VEHISTAKANPNYPYKNVWINQLLNEGRKPEIRIFCESNCTDSEQLHIQLCKMNGMILLNMIEVKVFIISKNSNSHE